MTVLTAEEPIAQVKATQPDESYKQRSVGIAKFENLELNAEGGRLFYEILDESGGEILHSARYSVEYAPETGEEITEPTAELLGTVRGAQLRRPLWRSQPVRSARGRRSICLRL